MQLCGGIEPALFVVVFIFRLALNGQINFNAIAFFQHRICCAGFAKNADTVNRRVKIGIMLKHRGGIECFARSNWFRQIKLNAKQATVRRRRLST